MSNAIGAKASREEEIAFLALEQVLGIDIILADAGAGNKKPDGSWVYPGGEPRSGVVEVTSPPAKDLMRKWARAKRERRPHMESGAMRPRLGELANVCSEMLDEAWARENFEKLIAQSADERHLYLFARQYEIQSYFYRLSDLSEAGMEEPIGAITLPEGISDVWFEGRASRDPCATDVFSFCLARFHVATGWNRYTVRLEEWQLPAPSRGIADDPFSAIQRRPKGRVRNPVAGS